jgi:O-antigen/teichoic acid export membrane protein
MVLIINAFLAIFANAGLKATTVQNQDFGIREHRAVYGLTWIVGAAVGVLFISLSPAAVFFFGEQRLYGICFTLAPAIFLTSLTQVPMGVLEKRMAFRQLALSHIISVFSASLISVLLAYFSFGYWALVYQIVLRNLFLLLLLLSITRIGWFPRFSREIYKRIFGYTGNLTGFKFLNYFSRNLDNILIGRFLGVFSLGLYSRAYSIMSVFRHAVGAVIGL